MARATIAHALRVKVVGEGIEQKLYLPALEQASNGRERMKLGHVR
ncbi:MAG TPA: hypothetical protein VGC35_14155 [Allosphingosinicella sp.]|jgi:hypothetical protein